MDSARIIKWVDELIESFRWESEMNTNELLSGASEEINELNTECEKLKTEIRSMLTE